MGKANLIQRCFIALFPLILLMGCTDRPSAGKTELDRLLETARKNNKIVMLELGSVGCIPCENMKPIKINVSDINMKG